MTFNKKVVLATTIALLIAAAFGFWKTVHTAPSTKTLPTQGNIRHGEESKRQGDHNVSELISSNSIDAQFVTAHGNKGFSIARTGPLRPPGNALEFVRSLIPASNSGNSVATFRIFLATLDCKRMLIGGVIQVDERDDAATKLTECESLLTETSIADKDWLTKAAEQGSVEAMVMYPINPDYTLPGGPREYLKDPEAVQKWREKSRQFLEQAASLGSQDALLSLSSAYGAGVVVEKNPVREMAYALAAQQVHPIPGFQEAYQPLRSSLSAPQIEQSEILARTIYQQCCKDQ
ncbi:sel1 repeat family protein [Stenotrophomonas maltophilia]|nr:sel1 repeat family protein [Stenotrophomonas maltophilia]